MKALMSADELARDVAGAEAMLDRHKERKGELDAQEDGFKASAQFGQDLIASGHYQSEEIRDIVRGHGMGRDGEREGFFCCFFFHLMSACKTLILIFSVASSLLPQHLLVVADQNQILDAQFTK